MDIVKNEIIIIKGVDGTETLLLPYSWSAITSQNKKSLIFF